MTTNKRIFWGTLGAGGLLAAALYLRRTRNSQNPETSDSPDTDPDPESKSDQILPSLDEQSSEIILDRREEGITGMKRRMQQTGKTISKGPGSREPGNVDSLVLHQTGFSRGNDPADYYKVTTHFVILPDGQIVWLHPFDEYLMASNKFNRRSVAVEFVGNFPGANGKCWKPEKFGCHTLSQGQKEAGRYLVDWLMQVVPNFKAVYAHRQSSAQKGNDPGPDIWRAIGEYAIHELGLEDTRDETVGGGKPIPESWRIDGNRSALFVEGPTATHHDQVDE